MRCFIRGLVVFLSLIAWNLPSLAHAGGWVVVTLDSLPGEVVAGQQTAIGFMVRQHGQNPIAGQNPKILLTHEATGERVSIAARDEGVTGHYVASILLPQSGAWDWKIEVWGEHMMPTLEVRPAAVGQISNPRAEARDAAEVGSLQSASATVPITAAALLLPVAMVLLWRGGLVTRLVHRKT